MRTWENEKWENEYIYRSWYMQCTLYISQLDMYNVHCIYHITRVKWYIQCTLHISYRAVILSYYKLGNFCVCVCVSVRLYVSTVWRETLYGSWHVSWANYFVCARNAHACACSAHILTACACYMKPIIASGLFIVTVYWTVMFSPNGRTDSLQISWERTTTPHKC
jgi:hypothetical protein